MWFLHVQVRKFAQNNHLLSSKLQIDPYPCPTCHQLLRQSRESLGDSFWWSSVWLTSPQNDGCIAGRPKGKTRNQCISHSWKINVNHFIAIKFKAALLSTFHKWKSKCHHRSKLISEKAANSENYNQNLMKPHTAFRCQLNACKRHLHWCTDPLPSHQWKHYKVSNSRCLPWWWTNPSRVWMKCYVKCLWESYPLYTLLMGFQIQNIVCRWKMPCSCGLWWLHTIP